MQIPLIVHPVSKFRVFVIDFWNQCVAMLVFIFYEELQH